MHYNLSEEQVRYIAYKAWQHIDPRPEEKSLHAFNIWWEGNKGLYLSPPMLEAARKEVRERLSHRIKNQRITT